MEINRSPVRSGQGRSRATSAPSGWQQSCLCLEWVLCPREERVLSGEGGSDSWEKAEATAICTARKGSCNISYFVNTSYQTGHITPFFHLRGKKKILKCFQPTSKELEIALFFMGWNEGNAVLSLPVIVPCDGPLMRQIVSRKAQGLTMIKHISLNKQVLQTTLGLSDGP